MGESDQSCESRDKHTGQFDIGITVMLEPGM